MSVDLTSLWEPVRVGPVTLPNRVFVPAHETQHGDRRRMSERYVAYVAERARGGAGLVMPGGASVHPHGEHIGHLPIWSPDCIPDYQMLADAVHAHGDAKVFVQLFHRGIQDPGTDRLDDWHAVPGPSEYASPIYGKVAKPMDDEEIADTVAHYGRSAANMRAAGIDGLELSAGHGYLICQFLSPLTNRRTDAYGGNVEKRARLLFEVLSEVRRQVGGDYPVGIRMSFDELVGETGITPDLAAEILGLVLGWGLIDYVNVSGINYHSLHYLTHPASSGLGAIFAEHAGRARQIVDGAIPVFVACGITTVEQAAEIVDAGQADAIGMARAHIADPALVTKAKAGHGDEIQRCVGANQGCIRRVVFKGKLSCTVNPTAGREFLWGDGPDRTAVAQSVLVVGGGPGGMKAAETAARAGHNVVLMERSAQLGGAIGLLAGLPSRARWAHLVQDLEGSLERLGVDVRLNTEATAEAVVAHGADHVVLATGAVYDHTGFSMNIPTRPGIPGAEQRWVLDTVQALTDPGAVGQYVVIIDDAGDHVALSTALALTQTGHTVEIVTAALHAGPNTLLTGELPFVLPPVLEAGVTLTVQSYVQQIDAGEVTIASVWGETEPRTAKADTVILNMLRQPNLALHDALAGQGLTVTRIGDCLAPRDVDDAILEGVRTGRDLSSGVGDGIPAHAGVSVRA